MMRGARCAAVDVEGDAEACEGVADEGVIAIDDLLRGDALLAGANRDGNAVLIGATDEHHLAAFEAKIAHVNVGRNIDAGKMSDVYAAVGIGQSGGDKSAVVHKSRYLYCND